MPEAAKPGERAVQQCEIDDVFLVQSHSKVDFRFNQSAVELEDTGVLHRVMIAKNVLHQTRTLVEPEGERQFITRYYIRGEIYFPRPGKTLEQDEIDYDEVSEEVVFAKLMHEFAVDYRCPAEFSEDEAAVSAFGRNAMFHAWSFWREAVMADCGRLRLPRVVIPMMKVPPPFKVESEQGAKAHLELPSPGGIPAPKDACK